MKSITMPSGAKLDISDSPFAISRALYQTILEEVKHLKLDSSDEVANLTKDAVCTLLSSKKVEVALEECLKRCAYNGRRIDNDTWEPINAREDYIEVCFEVAKENLFPFGKNLMSKYSAVFEKLKSSSLA